MARDRSAADTANGTTEHPQSPELLPDTEQIGELLATGRRVRRSLPGQGRLYLDRLLPFLVLYRTTSSSVEPALESLATTEAAYLVASVATADAHRAILQLLAQLSTISVQEFGGFLVIEMWTRSPRHAAAAEPVAGLRAPGFRLFGEPEGAPLDAILNVVQRHLQEIRVMGQHAAVDRPRTPHTFPDRPEPVAGSVDRVFYVGIEIEPCFRSPDTNQVFPGVLRGLRTRLSRALRHCVYHFVRQETKHRPADFNALGRRDLSKTVWDIDARLDGIATSFDFLLCVNPHNVVELWREFRGSNYERLPQLRYRPIPVDIALTKRALFEVPIERVEDPTLAHVFTEKQEELDRQLTMLKDRGTKRFMLGGLQIYGPLSPGLLRTAEELLERVPGTASESRPDRLLETAELIRLAEEEIAHYRLQWDGVQAKVLTSDTVLAGLMVSGGNLLVPTDLRTPLGRVTALLHHEIGTHLVTYYNGKAQPLSQLRTGFAGHEELQEGLAVLAEYLVGGMTPDRLRTLAARVLAARALMDGATFVDTFRSLCRFGFSPHGAFTITLRIYRGGGLIKDCIYLRGLETLLDYLREGRDLARLYLGKIALKHLEIVNELATRQVLGPMRLRPRFLDDPESQRRLATLRQGIKTYQLAQGANIPPVGVPDCAPEPLAP